MDNYKYNKYKVKYINYKNQHAGALRALQTLKNPQTVLQNSKNLPLISILERARKILNTYIFMKEKQENLLSTTDVLTKEYEIIKEKFDAITDIVHELRLQFDIVMNSVKIVNDDEKLPYIAAFTINNGRAEINKLHQIISTSLTRIHILTNHRQ